MATIGSITKAVINLSEQRELSDAARALINDRAFGYVFAKLQQQYVGQLLGLTEAGQRQDELCARLRALETILAELGALLTDHREAVKRATRNA